MSNFIDKCLRGEALLEEIDDFIDEWHESDQDEPLSIYLGMSPEEYALWVKDSDNLSYIIDAHKSNITYEEAVAKAASMAARSDNVDKIVQIEAWLKTRSENA